MGNTADDNTPWWIFVLSSEKERPYYMNYFIIGKTKYTDVAQTIIDRYDASHITSHDVEEVFALRQPPEDSKYVVFIFTEENCFERAYFLSELDFTKFPEWRPIQPEEAARIEPFKKILQYINPKTNEMAIILPLII